MNLEEGMFICEIPGFLMHRDEVSVTTGIPLGCIAIEDTDLIVDTDGTGCDFAMHIKRSFRSNCVARLMRVHGEIRIGLFATRMKGVLTEERPRRGPAVLASCELMLPFDGDLPYPVKKCEWREKRSRIRSTKKMVKERTQKYHELTLLSSFSDDGVPRMPFILVRDSESVQAYLGRMQKERNRAKHGRGRRLDVSFV
jgi:hypothetical protein